MLAGISADHGGFSLKGKVGRRCVVPNCGPLGYSDDIFKV